VHFVTLQKTKLELTSANKKILSYSIKAVVLILAFGFIYSRINNNDNLRQFSQLVAQISTPAVYETLTLVFLLMLLNWVLEALKWKYLTRHLEPMSTWRAIEAVFCGLTWAIFTPNRIGEFGGRVLFLSPRKRIHGVFAMAVGAFSQHVITNICGVIGVLWFISTFLEVNRNLFYAGATLALSFVILLSIFFFHVRWLVALLSSIPFLKKFERFFGIMARYTINELMRVMTYSVLRFIVFSSQYYFIIHLLIPEISLFHILMMVFILFFIQSALPSLDLLDIGVRGATATYFFSFITSQDIAIIAAVSCIWLVNLIIPAILGSVFVLKLNFFGRS
jgi:hypothetical protein